MSSATTSAPAISSASTRCDPMKPPRPSRGRVVRPECGRLRTHVGGWLRGRHARELIPEVPATPDENAPTASALARLIERVALIDGRSIVRKRGPCLTNNARRYPSGASSDIEHMIHNRPRCARGTCYPLFSDGASETQRLLIAAFIAFASRLRSANARAVFRTSSSSRGFRSDAANAERSHPCHLARRGNRSPLHGPAREVRRRGKR